MIELKPCPFCGYKKPEFYDLGQPGDFEDWGVQCSNCDIVMLPPAKEPGCIATQKDAAAAWNRRVKDGV